MYIHLCVHASIDETQSCEKERTGEACNTVVTLIPKKKKKCAYLIGFRYKQYGKVFLKNRKKNDLLLSLGLGSEVAEIPVD